MDHARRPDSRALGFLAVLAGIAGLRWAQGLFVPLTIAVLASLLLAPLVKRVEHLVRHRLLAVVLILTTLFVAVGSAGWVASRQVANLADQFPKYRVNIRQKLANLNTPIGRMLEKVYDITDELAHEETAAPKNGARPVPVEVVRPPITPFDFLSNAMGTLAEGLGTVAVVFIVMFLFLLFQQDVRDRLVQIAGARWVNVTTRTLDESAAGVSRFLLTQTLLNVGFGLTMTALLLLLGVPNSLLWGLAAGLLRFVPYIGIWIGLALPAVFSMAIFPDWSRPLLLLAVGGALELILANVLEPWLYGKGTGLSPLAVILCALFWAWLWGPVGLLLAVPLTTCLATLGRVFRDLSFLNTLLGSHPPLQPGVRLYQRLLSRNAEAAFSLAEEFLKEGSAHELYEQLVIPALILGRQNHAAGELDDAPYERMLAGAAELVDEAALPDDTPTPGPGPRARVLLIPADDEADELCGRMIARLLAGAPADLSQVPADLLAGEKAERLRTEDADVLVVSALPPSAVLHVRHLCKRLRPQLGKAAIVVAAWGSTAGDAEILSRIGVDARVVRTLSELVQTLNEHVAAAVLGKRAEPAKIG